MKIKSFLLLLLFLQSILIHSQEPIKIVVLGSSTAYGVGPIDIQNSWVNLFKKYVQEKNKLNEVINLAVGGFTTYNILPTQTSSQISTQNRPTPSVNNNITSAVSYKPNVILINLPTNDIANVYSVDEIINNYKILVRYCDNQNIPIFITSTQPRNFSIDYRNMLKVLNDSLYKNFNQSVIDFWSDIADNSGKILTIYDCGDGAHLNDLAHKLLCQRVIQKKIHSSLDDLACVYKNSSLNIKSEVNIDFVRKAYRISYFIPFEGNVKMILFNLNGNIVNTIFNKDLEIGNYSFDLNFENIKGLENVKGFYIYKILLSDKSKSMVYTSKILNFK